MVKWKTKTWEIFITLANFVPRQILLKINVFAVRLRTVLNMSRSLEDVLARTFYLMISLENVLKTSLQNILKMSWRRLEDVFNTPWRRFETVLKKFFQDVLKTFWSCLEDVLARRLQDVLKTFLQEVLKTSWKYLEDVLARRLENVLKTPWRCMTKTNILVLIKTSWRHLLKTKMKGVFKTSSRRLHQDEFLLEKFWIYQGSDYASDFEYARILNVPEFWICQGYTGFRICLNNSWICLIMSGYVWICMNMYEYA